MQQILYFIFIYVISFGTFGFQDSIAVEVNLKYDTNTVLQPVDFNQEKIEDYKTQKEFNYLEEIENDSWWIRFKRWLNMQYQRLIDWLFGDYNAHTLVVIFLEILPYLILGVVIGLIVWIFIRLNPGPSLLAEPMDPEVHFNEEEKIVRSQDIPSLIEEAVKKGDYRLAIRYYYLQLLKILNEKGLINYEFQKTDAEYLSEIENDNFKRPLKQVMRIYDFIWYGGFNVSEKDFAVAQNTFQDLESSLSKLPNEK